MKLLIRFLLCRTRVLLITGICLSCLQQSCCNEETNSQAGFTVNFDDTTKIEKIEFVGTGNSTIVASSTAYVTLNPEAAECTFLIFYNGISGSVTLTYSGKFTNESGGCHNELRKVYEVSVKSHSFNNIKVNSGMNYSGSGDNIGYITLTR